ncbi:MAG: nuclear transport factor 2 family protein [Flavobacteriaceae bacterium]|nr:nuclear transport factor 2 family protein [Bacteroidia bacterium]NNK28655.1 nuclear transport factor 2 family protein [Flavobacteriaceae bacterium]NNL61690.1 nuclear transport factor 2 family protein [Flavobacteriaceae bacterium]
MKKLIILGLAIVLFVCCNQQEQRYFAESAQTKTLEAGIAAYESGDWDTWRSHFADTAKIFVNSKEAITLDKRVEDLAGMTSAFSSYGFDKDEAYIEMVIDKEDETWVYFWGQHEGTMKNGKELSIPVHLAVQFTDGKIIEEHIYFDGTEMNAAMAALSAPVEEEQPEN